MDNCARHHTRKPGQRRSSVISRAFTLIDMMMTLTIIATAAVIVVPMMSDDGQLRVTAAANVLRSDIELAQVMTIAHPARPVIVRFAPRSNSYWLAYEDTPDTPLVRENGETYHVTFGVGRARTAKDVSMSLQSMPDNRLTFNAHGGLTNLNAQPEIHLQHNSTALKLTISPSTGSIAEAEVKVDSGKGKGQSKGKGK